MAKATGAHLRPTNQLATPYRQGQDTISGMECSSRQVSAIRRHEHLKNPVESLTMSGYRFLVKLCKIRIVCTFIGNHSKQRQQLSHGSRNGPFSPTVKRTALLNPVLKALDSPTARVSIAIPFANRSRELHSCAVFVCLVKFSILS